ncbi:MAG: molybdopterin-binding protein, partial [Oscillospiraceae bacterium]
LGALLAGGVLTVKVLKKPVVGIIPTGDEIVPPCQEPKKGDIIEFNSAIFSAMLTEWGAEPVTFPIVKDVREDIRGALRHALDTCDMVLLGAGSSAGREDFSSEVIGSLGRVIVHGVAMKPGKPAILGICDGKPVVGVPGYPVSGILVLEQFVRPLVDLQLGRPATLPQTAEATLARRVTS